MPDLFDVFNANIEKKYKLSETDFESMSRVQRNFILEKMCENESLIVFSNKKNGK